MMLLLMEQELMLVIIFMVRTKLSHLLLELIVQLMAAYPFTQFGLNLLAISKAGLVVLL